MKRKSWGDESGGRAGREEGEDQRTQRCQSPASRRATASFRPIRRFVTSIFSEEKEDGGRSSEEGEWLTHSVPFGTKPGKSSQQGKLGV